MAPGDFPKSIYDLPRQLMEALGSWWSRDFQAVDQILDIVRAKARVEQQTVQMLDELTDALALRSVPLYRKDLLLPLRLRESERGTVESAYYRYDVDGLQYDTDQVRYDQRRQEEAWYYPKPEGLVSLPLILNRIQEPAVIWVEGTDYIVTDDAIVFREDPAADPRFASRADYVNGDIADREILLWGVNACFDERWMEQQYGHVVGMDGPSSEPYRDFLQQVFEALMTGPSVRNITGMVAAAAGIPVSRADQETVEDIVQEPDGLLIITDRNVYRFAPQASPRVRIGDRIERGTVLVDSLEVWEPAGDDPVPEEFKAITLGPGLLGGCYQGELTFPNRQEELDIEVSDGYVKLSWPVGGFPDDVRQFFDTLHARGIAASEIPIDECEDAPIIRYPQAPGEPDRVQRKGTLAHFLDGRPVAVGEPSADNLPATVNPAEMLVQSVFPGAAALLRLQLHDGNPQGAGLHHLDRLQDLIPAGMIVMLSVEGVPRSDVLPVDLIQEALTALLGPDPLEEAVSLPEESVVQVRIIKDDGA